MSAFARSGQSGRDLRHRYRYRCARQCLRRSRFRSSGAHCAIPPQVGRSVPVASRLGNGNNHVMSEESDKARDKVHKEFKVHKVNEVQLDLLVQLVNKVLLEVKVL